MRLTNILLAAVALQASAAAGADVLQVQTGGGAVKPVPIDVASVPKDSPEAIAKVAARDLKDSHFYNKPGATRAQYDADWQQCRLIARGSTTPTGSIPYYYIRRWSHRSRRGSAAGSAPRSERPSSRGSSGAPTAATVC